MGPDYAKYDVTQLRQALGTIDSARFLARAEEIKVRLAALEHSAHVNPTAPAARLGPTAHSIFRFCNRLARC